MLCNAPPRTVLFIETAALLAQTFDRSQVTRLRHAVASCASAAGLAGQRLEDFVLAVNELITNAVRHGGGRGRIRLWRANRDVVCEISDEGAGIDAARLGNHDRPRLDTAGGWGLWLARQLSDRMEVRTGPAGTTVRIIATLGPASLAEEGAH